MWPNVVNLIHNNKYIYCNKIIVKFIIIKIVIEFLIYSIVA